jgi:hypothetical protein
LEGPRRYDRKNLIGTGTSVLRYCVHTLCVCTILHCVCTSLHCVCTILVRWSGTWYLFFFKNSILYEIQLLDELVVGSFGPRDACAACDGIFRHFAFGSYLLKVWWVKTHSYLPKKTRSVKRNMPPSKGLAGHKDPPTTPMNDSRV